MLVYMLQIHIIMNLAKSLSTDRCQPTQKVLFTQIYNVLRLAIHRLCSPGDQPSQENDQAPLANGTVATQSQGKMSVEMSWFAFLMVSILSSKRFNQ